MTFSVEWERTYADGGHRSIWPWSDLVSLVRRHCRQLGPGHRILEIGCGAGANIPFLLSTGADYYGIDGSATAIDDLRQRFPHIEPGGLIAGDFTRGPFPEVPFDLVVDRASLTHNPSAAIEQCLGLVWEALRPEGIYAGVDWFSTDHHDYSLGSPVDQYARTGFSSGQFAGIGVVHFADERRLRALFSRFEILWLAHKLRKRIIPEDGGTFAAWDIVARKPKARCA